MSERDLDVKDRRILNAIELKGRFFISDIAKKVGLSKEVVGYRLGVLEKRGLIKRYRAIVNLSCLGFSTYHVSINLMDVTPEDTDAIFDYLKKQPEVISIREANVVWDVLFRVAVKSNKDFLKFMDGFKERFKKFMEITKISIIHEEELLPRQYLLPPSKESTLKAMHSIKVEERNLVPFNDLDISILQLLVKDARTHLLAISKELKIDSMTVKRHIERMEKEGIIAGYVTDIDLKPLGITTFSVRLTLSDTKRLKAMQAHVCNLPEAIKYKRDIGGYDLNFDVDVPNLVRFEEMIIDLKRSFPVVREVEHFTTLRRHKTTVAEILNEAMEKTA